MNDRFFRVTEVADILRLSRSHTYRLVKQKRIPSIRLSERRIVIRESDLLRWILHNYVPGLIDEY